MKARHGPSLFSLNYNMAPEAVSLIRRREADPHHGQGKRPRTGRIDLRIHCRCLKISLAAGGVHRFIVQTLLVARTLARVDSNADR